MKKQTVNFISILISAGLMTACSRGGDWPDLSKPVTPDSESAPQDKAHIVARPTAPSPQHNGAPVPVTQYERDLLVQETAKAFSDAAERAKKEIQELEFARPDDRQATWHGAQITLTRLSQITDRLNGLINNNHQGAIDADTRMSETLDELRQLLNRARP